MLNDCESLTSSWYCLVLICSNHGDSARIHRSWFSRWTITSHNGPKHCLESCYANQACLFLGQKCQPAKVQQFIWRPGRIQQHHHSWQASICFSQLLHQRFANVGVHIMNKNPGTRDNCPEESNHLILYHHKLLIQLLSGKSFDHG